MDPMVLDTKYFTAEYAESIIRVQYKPRVHLSLADAEAIVAERLNFYVGVEAPVLIRNAHVKSIEKAARDYLFDKDKGLRNIKAVAVVHDNIMNRLLATMIFHRHTPSVPHKMFTDEEKAVNWLKQFI